ncbi:MAG: NUDIX domain-containing protein [Acetobacteraceae bacterium]|nr:NUDIX domain-containing protein [Acetobacteraceae bacterium]
MQDSSDTHPNVEIQQTETLCDDWYRLDKVRFKYTRRDGTSQDLAREVYHNGPGAAVLLLDPAGENVVLTRQIRIPAYVNGDPPMLIEVCAGMIEPGEEPSVSARKEAEQETGYRIGDLRQVFVLYTSPGASAEKLYLYVATYDPHQSRNSAGGGVRTEGEDIEILELPLERAWAMVEAGEIVDAKTVLLLQHVLIERAASNVAADRTAPMQSGLPMARGGMVRN